MIAVLWWWVRAVVATWAEGMAVVARVMRKP